MQLTAADVADLVRGCEALGSGGGGSTLPVEPLLADRLLRHGPVEIVDLAALPGDTCLLTVGAVGSPTVMRERVPAGEEFGRAVATYARYSGRRPGALVPLEIAGVNGLLAPIVASHTGLPLVDADAMGRAFPRLEQCVLDGVLAATPLALANPSGGVLVLDELPHAAVAATVRGSLPSLGAWAAISAYPGTASDYARCVLRGSITRALEVGRGLAAGLDRPDLWAGTVLEVVRRPSATGVLVLAGEADQNSTLRVDLADEYICAQLDGRLLAVSPDIITLVDARTLRPVGVPDVRPGQRLRLLVLEAPPPLREDAGRWGPASYGLAEPMPTAVAT